MFGNDVSEHHMSTTKNPASIIMIGVSYSIEREEASGLARTGLQANIEALETKVLPWIKKMSKRSNYVYQQDRAPARTVKTLQNWLDDKHELLFQRLLTPPPVTRYKPPRLQLVNALRKRLARHATLTQMSSRLL